MRILLVDDSKAARRFLLRALDDAGVAHRTTEAEDGSTALNLLREKTFDLVLCDWNMPEINGVELLRIVRATGRKIRFGVISSLASGRDVEVALKSGADFVLAKPVQVPALRDAFAALERRSA